MERKKWSTERGKHATNNQQNIDNANTWLRNGSGKQKLCAK